MIVGPGSGGPVWATGGAECRAEAAGIDPRRLAAVLREVEARGTAAQIFLARGGNVVLDRAFGCRSDALFLLFSAGKPFVAVLIHLLAERGVIDLDAPVADYWPQFAEAGKGVITIRQVLQHRSGL